MRNAQNPDTDAETVLDIRLSFFNGLGTYSESGTWDAAESE